jgi:hypothetical protein
MGLLTKLKAVWTARKVVNQMGEIKRGWKTLSFWVVLVTNLLALIAALKGLLPAGLALILLTAVTAVYNILRGAQKSHEEGMRSWFKTTEFWMGVGTEISKAFVALQAEGINPAWMGTTSTILAGVMTISRDLSAKSPSKPDTQKPAATPA